MACLSITVNVFPQATLTVRPLPQAALRLRGYATQEPATTVAVRTSPSPMAAVAVRPMMSVALAVTPKPQAQLTVGEVCSVSAGELYVLASTDGPLRTRNGGYILLDPSHYTDD